MCEWQWTRVLCAQRPTAHELLKHPFLKRAKKTAFLLDLIERYKKWKAEGGDSRDRGDSSSSSDDDDEPRCALRSLLSACPGRHSHSITLTFTLTSQLCS